MAPLRLSLLLLLLPLACKGPDGPGSARSPFTPPDAIRLAAKSPDGVQGVFEVTILRAEAARGMVYLNSEADYRDPRCLTVAVTPSVAGTLMVRLGVKRVEDLRNRTLRVKGTARQVKVHFTDKGRVTDRFYVQTHVFVDGASQVSFL